jgi:hypothetical protein
MWIPPRFSLLDVCGLSHVDKHSRVILVLLALAGVLEWLKTWAG